jgi:bifunctional DNase/RNase
MKKSYEKPTLVRREKLSKVTAIPSDSLILAVAVDA